MCIYYGQALGGYGWPYMEDADVILLRGTNEHARHVINRSLTPGVNFALYAYLDDGRGTNVYHRTALYTGDVVSIVVQDPYGQKTIMESNAVPPVGKPGDIILINVTAGVDTDHDGLPDQWEQELIDWGTHPHINTLVEVVGSDDYDGDGQSNEDEYRAGTFAFLDYDYFFAEHLDKTPSNWLRIEFLSVPGKIYQVFSTTNVVSGIWDLCEYSLADGGPLQTDPAEGDGDWLSLYVPLTQTNRALRLAVQ